MHKAGVIRPVGPLTPRYPAGHPADRPFNIVVIPPLTTVLI